MTTLHVTLPEVLAAIPVEKLKAVTGILSKKSNPPFDYIVKCKIEPHQLTGYGDMPVSTTTGTVLKLKDIASKIDRKPYPDGNFTHLNGKQGISILVMQLADSSYNKMQLAIKEVMGKAVMDFPNGIKHQLLFNPKDSLYISHD